MPLAKDNTKYCNQCGITYSGALKDFFTTDRSKNDGLHTLCKKCKNGNFMASYYDNHETELETRKQWRLDNPGKKAAYGKKWFNTHQDWVKEYREENRDHNKAYCEDWKNKNPDKV